MYIFQYKKKQYKFTRLQYNTADRIRMIFGQMTLGDAFAESGNPR